MTQAGAAADVGPHAGGAAAWLLAAGLLLAAALGVPGEEMLQDTLKSAIVAFAALFAALSFFFAQRRSNAPLRWHGALWLPLGLAVYALGSMAWSHPYLAGVEAVRWFLFALIAWLALNTLSRECLPMLALCVHAGAVIASGWAAWQFWGGFDLFPQGPQPASTFINRNFFAEYAVCTLPFSAWLLARARGTLRIAALAASNALVVTALLMTGTRGALLAMGLLLFVVLPLGACRCRTQLAFPQWSPAQRVIALGLLAATVAVLGSVPTSNPAILDEGHGATPLARGLQRAQSIGPSDDSLGVRMEMWRATLRAIAAHPLAGVGAGAWENEIPLYQEEGTQLEPDYYAHNEFLQLVAEYGAVGWAFLAALLAWLAHAGRRTWGDGGEAAAAERPLRVVFLASLLALMVVSAIGFPWRLAVTGAMFALCVGGLAASDARLGKRSPLAAVQLPWSPAIARGALVAAVACIMVAVHVTHDAAAAESRLVRAARLAVALTRTHQPQDPANAPLKQEMLQLVREGIALNPHYRKITPVVADELARWGDWADAVWIWQSVLQSRPHVVAVLTNVARGYEMLGRLDEAHVYLAQARSLRPRAPSVRSLEVLLLARHGREPEALRKGEAALADGIVDYDMVNTTYLLAMRGRDYPLAAALLERRMREWPESRSLGLVQLGVLDDEGFHDADKALAAFRLGIASAPVAERAQLLQAVPDRYRPQLAPLLPQTSASSR
jgi:O-antigen ligase